MGSKAGLRREGPCGHLGGRYRRRSSEGCVYETPSFTGHDRARESFSSEKVVEHLCFFLCPNNKVGKILEDSPTLHMTAGLWDIILTVLWA